MISTAQTRIIHRAKRELGYDDADYRNVLRNIGGLTGEKPSSTDLNNATFEQVMAFFESVGWVDSYRGRDYWSNKANQQGRGMISDRQRRLIEKLASEYGELQLPGFLLRMTRHRTDQVTDLRSWEAHKVIEGLKAMVQRGAPADRPAAAPEPTRRQYAPPTEAELAQMRQDELPV